MSSDTPNDAFAGVAVPRRSQRRRAGHGTGALTPLRCSQGHGAAAGRGFGSSLADEKRNRWDWPKASFSFRPAGEESLGPGDPYSTRKPREVPNVPGQDCRSSRLFGTGRYHGVVDLAPVHSERPSAPKRPPSFRRGQMHHLHGTPVRLDKGHGSLGRQPVGGG